MEKYKGHIIETKWLNKGGSSMGWVWIVDGKVGFHSRKDAKAYINGQSPRWGFAKL